MQHLQNRFHASEIQLHMYEFKISIYPFCSYSGILALVHMHFIISLTIGNNCIVSTFIGKMYVFTFNQTQIILTIWQNLIGFWYQFKYTLSLLLISWILVWMPLQCHLTVAAHHIKHTSSRSLPHRINDSLTTTTVLQSSVSDYPGELVPEG